MRGCSGHLATSNIVLSKITRHLVESFRYPCRAEARHLDDDPHPCTQIALGRVQVHRNSATHPSNMADRSRCKECDISARGGWNRAETLGIDITHDVRAQ
jgi:hypothetical protein